jgi:hypothetical protein
MVAMGRSRRELAKHSYVISAQQHNSKIRRHELEIQVHRASMVRVSFFGGNLSSANFGPVVRAADPRRVQLAVKLLF